MRAPPIALCVSLLAALPTPAGARPAAGGAGPPESAGPPGAPAEEGRGLAVPAEEAWGDEWFDHEAARAAERERERILAEEAERLAREREAAAAAAADGAPAADPSREVPAILPPRASFADLDRAWHQRRQALRLQDRKAAAEAEARLLEVREELDVPELHALAAAVLRESRGQEAISSREAVARAELAVELGPSLPGTHFQLARARFRAAPGAVASWLGPALDGIATVATVPRWSRPLLAHLAAAVLLGLLFSGGAVLVLLALRHGPLALHDFHHLFPRGARPVQTGALALLLVAAPAVLGAGPFAAAAAVAGAVWLYLGRAERLVVAGLFAVLGIAPLLVGQLGGLVAGGPVERGVWDLERAGAFASLPALEQRAHLPGAEPEVLFAVARARKREGDLDGAAALYERALASRPRWPEALVNLGNVRLLQGREDDALSLYSRALARRPSLAPAYFGLARLHFRRFDLAPGKEARDRALALDRSLVHRFEEGGPLRANLYLLDVPLDPAALSGSLPPEQRQLLAAEAARLLLGPLPADAGPWAAAAWLAALGALALLVPRHRVSVSCEKCGRAACRRCDPEVGRGGLCGQCVYVYLRRDGVGPAARLQKEVAVRRRIERRRRLRRALAFVLAGPVVSGRVARGWILLAAAGALVVLLLESPIRPVEGGPPAALRWSVAAPLLAAVWLFGVGTSLRKEE